MSAPEILRQRAQRILSDGLRHADAVILWAHSMVRRDQGVGQLRLEGFTLREIALGSYEVAAL